MDSMIVIGKRHSASMFVLRTQEALFPHFTPHVRVSPHAAFHRSSTKSYFDYAPSLVAVFPSDPVSGTVIRLPFIATTGCCPPSSAGISSCLEPSEFTLLSSF